MSRYGWSRQESYQPYPAGTVPFVTDQDFTYITSEDLNPYPIDPRYSAPSLAPAIEPEYEADDVLHISLDSGREYQLQFPAYSIGDGKLYVRDVQSRIAFLQNIEEHQSPNIRLYYKGRLLDDPNQLVRAYGCKNNSALICHIPTASFDDFAREQREREARNREWKERERQRQHDRYRDSAIDSGSEDETVVVTDEHGRVLTERRPSRRKSTVKHSGSGGYRFSAQPSPRSSGASVNFPSSPTTMGNSFSRRSGRQNESPAMKKLSEIEDHFNAHLKPLFEDFAKSPPADQQKREEEHKKLEEITMQQVILKCDEVETDGDDEIRTRRKALVNYVQEYLKVIDNKK